jgi:hypothetical protein
MVVYRIPVEISVGISVGNLHTLVCTVSACHLFKKSNWIFCKKLRHAECLKTLVFGNISLKKFLETLKATLPYQGVAFKPPLCSLPTRGKDKGPLEFIDLELNCRPLLEGRITFFFKLIFFSKFLGSFRVIKMSVKNFINF